MSRSLQHCSQQVLFDHIGLSVHRDICTYRDALIARQAATGMETTILTAAFTPKSVVGTRAAYATLTCQPLGSLPGSPKAPTCKHAMQAVSSLKG